MGGVPSLGIWGVMVSVVCLCVWGLGVVLMFGCVFRCGRISKRGGGKTNS